MPMKKQMYKGIKTFLHFYPHPPRYLDLRGLSSGTGPVNWPDQYGPAERDEAYKSFSLSGWAGRSGHDAPMIALDALLGAGSNWGELMSRAGLHGGQLAIN